MANEEHESPEEIAAEQEALKGVEEADVRAEVIEKFGFDEEADKDRIDKVTAHELEGRKKLSTAIRQKIKHRDALKNAKPVDPKDPTPPAPKKEDSKDEPQLSFKDQRALDKADVHDDDLDEVIKYAKFNNITVAQALQKPILINTLADNAEKRATAIAANGPSTRRHTAGASDDEIVAAANAGKLPEDDASIAKLMAAKAPKQKKR